MNLCVKKPNMKYVLVMKVITIAVVVLFTKKGLYVNTSLLLSKCFNDITRNGITRLYRCHPFTILNDDLFNFLMK